MKFINAIFNRLKRIKENYQATRQARRLKQLENISCKNINVTEFNGRLYIAYDGVPIVRVEDLKYKAPARIPTAPSLPVSVA